MFHLVMQGNKKSVLVQFNYHAGRTLFSRVEGLMEAILIEPDIKVYQNHKGNMALFKKQIAIQRRKGFPSTPGMQPAEGRHSEMEPP